jgi:SHC-transforming protein 1
MHFTEPFSTAISEMNKLSPQTQKQQLKQEIWYHGSVSRSEAESILTRVYTYFLININVF